MKLEINETESCKKSDLALIPFKDAELYINKLNRVCVHVYHWDDKYPEISYGVSYTPKGKQKKMDILFFRFDDKNNAAAHGVISITDLEDKYPFDYPIIVDLKYETAIMFLAWEDFNDIRKEDTGDITEE